MASYNEVSISEKDPDSPLTASLVDKLDQNPLALFEGAAGAPRLQNNAINDNSINPRKIRVTNYTVNAGFVFGDAEFVSGEAWSYDYGKFKLFFQSVIWRPTRTYGSVHINIALPFNRLLSEHAYYSDVPIEYAEQYSNYVIFRGERTPSGRGGFESAPFNINGTHQYIIKPSIVIE